MEMLVTAAIEARENSYSPYSKFKVGAALLGENGKIYRGCNVENASYSATICAERVAISKAISEGAEDFKAIAIACGEEYCYPCGICRQFMSELTNPEEFTVIVDNLKGDYKTYKLIELFPHAFKIEQE